MNRIQELFKTKKNNILSIYITAGFPHLDDTRTIIFELQKAGADMIEIG
ncbi:MAG: tryptophan synthase subunit alpha, partial [Bacteroidales bacterium]